MWSKRDAEWILCGWQNVVKEKTENRERQKERYGEKRDCTFVSVCVCGLLVRYFSFEIILLFV